MELYKRTQKRASILFLQALQFIKYGNPYMRNIKFQAAVHEIFRMLLSWTIPSKYCYY